MPVRTIVTDAVAEIVLDAPPLNVLDIALLDGIVAAFRAAGADDRVRAVVLRSASPKVFSAGLDLDGVRSGDAAHVRALLDRLYITLADVQFELGKPSIAAITGSARGGGMTLAIQCNMIVAGAGATFGYPEIDVGLLPAIHFAHLPRIVGRHRAAELLFTGRAFDAQEAQVLGLVSRVVDDANVSDEAITVARTLAAKPPGAMAAAHRTFMALNDYRTEIAKVVPPFVKLAAAPEARAAIASFRQRRD